MWGGTSAPTTIPPDTKMKKLYSLLILALAASTVTLKAAINEAYNAPKLVDVQSVNRQAYLMFTAPVMGGTVWESNISNASPMGGLTVVSGSTSFYNGGANGCELNESPSMESYTLATPEVSLEAGTTYHLGLRTAGSRSSNNKTLAVVVSRGGKVVKTIIEAYELSPSLMYENHDANFTVDESGADYTIQFVVTAGAKTAGAGLMNIQLSAAEPEGRGALTGYNIWRDGEMVHTFLPTEAEQGALFLTYTHAVTLEWSTSYSFALQAVYEGGESPLTEAKTLTTPNDPLAGVEAIATDATTNGARYDLQGRPAHHTTRGISISRHQKTLVR